MIIHWLEEAGYKYTHRHHLRLFLGLLYDLELLTNISLGLLRNSLSTAGTNRQLSQSDKQTYRETDRQEGDRQTDNSVSQTNRHTEKQTGKRGTDKQTTQVRHTEKQTGKKGTDKQTTQSDKQTYRETDIQRNRQAGGGQTNREKK